MAGIFKAYDIRGTVPDQLDPSIAFRIGYGFATFLAKETGKTNPLVVLGRDMRVHSNDLAAAFTSGLDAGGARIVDIGLSTTPMTYVAVGLLEADPMLADGGVQVTASHNPGIYNGFKLCRAGAVPISGATGLQDIEALSKEAPDAPVEFGAVETSAFPIAPVEEVESPEGCDPFLWARYLKISRGLIQSWPDAPRLAVDPANGMGCLDLAMLRQLGVHCESVNDHLDGSFPVHEANPLKVENLTQTSELLKSSGAMLGVAFDGDSDRAVFVDEQGTPVSSDLAVALIAGNMLKREPGAAILYDLRSSRAVPEHIESLGGRPVRERVGHSFMKATMRRENCISGGELSGHFYFRDVFYTDNALVAVIEMLNVLGAEDKALSELIEGIQRYAQSGESNYIVEDKDAAMKRIEEANPDAEVDWLDGVTVQYKDWWANVRPSNTEPLLRLNLEANTPEEVARRVKEMEAIIGGKPESGGH